MNPGHQRTRAQADEIRRKVLAMLDANATPKVVGMDLNISYELARKYICSLGYKRYYLSEDEWNHIKAWRRWAPKEAKAGG